MDVKHYYQMTLDKWRTHAEGKLTDIASICGFCQFANLVEARIESMSPCDGCPALKVWSVAICEEIEEIGTVIWAGKDDLPAAAADVVRLLEENEEALLEAMRIEARKCGLEVT